jgi:hypothetical protein
MHAVAQDAGHLYGWGSNAGGQIGAAATRQVRPLSFLAIS